MTTDTLLTPAEVWSAKIYSNGWKKPGLGTADVTEKATGTKLGEIGIASAEDVAAAAATARRAQKDWAKAAGSEAGRRAEGVLPLAACALRGDRQSDRPRDGLDPGEGTVGGPDHCPRVHGSGGTR